MTHHTVIKGDQMHICKKDMGWYPFTSPPNHLATNKIATKKRTWLYRFKESKVYAANKKNFMNRIFLLTVTLSY